MGMGNGERERGTGIKILFSSEKPSYFLKIVF